jgi:molecular chaperone GrpE
MTDTPSGPDSTPGTDPETNEHNDNNTPVSPEQAAQDAAAEEARRKRNEELFGDLEEDETPEEILAERDRLQQQLIEMAAQILRARSENAELLKRVEEMDKSFKRAEAKFEDDKKFALQKFVKEVLPVIDTLELALKALPPEQRATDPKFDKIAVGVEKTLSQLTAVFNKFGIREINPLNESFDHTKHQVLTTEANDDLDPETVVKVAQKGYEIEGRVIRPAKVIITPP